MKEFIASDWRQIFIERGLSFDFLWRLPLKPLGGYNTGRGCGGWSTAGSLSLHFPNGAQKRLIIKRQKNHTKRTFRHPFRGIPTLAREISSIFLYKRFRIPTPKPVFYAQRSAPDSARAILITEYLEGYTPLDELVRNWQEHGWPKRNEREPLLRAIASVLGKLHQNRLQHNCLYPKHVLIRQAEHEVLVALIDLEKNKWRPFGNGRRVRDLESLFRRTEGWSRTDYVRFLNAYWGIHRRNKRSLQLCRRIIKRTQNKRQR